MREIYPCTLCSSELDLRSTEQGVRFFCRECGFEKIGPLGYSKQEAYEFITKNRKSKTVSQGFPIKNKSIRRSSSNHKKVKLESDAQIEKNAQSVRSKLDKNLVPEELEQTIADPSHLPVFFSQLPKTSPPLGKSIEESITIPGMRKKLEEKGINRLYQYQEEFLI